MELIKQNHDVTHSFYLLFEEYQEKVKIMNEISSSKHAKSDVLNYFLTASSLHFSYDKLFNFDKAKAVLNSEMWRKVINMTNVLKYMPAEDRNQWEEDLRTYNTPDFTEENVIPTIQNLLMEQDTFFAKKVDGIFRNLSGEHVTNSPSGFSKKMIFKITNYYDSIDTDKTAFIDDLRFCILKILQNKEEFKFRRTYDDLYQIQQIKEFGTWFDLDGGSIRIKLFKKGTIHVEVNPYIAIQLNQILAKLYPSAIPTKHRSVSKKIKKFELRNDFLSEDVQEELLRMLKELRYNNSFLFYPRKSKETNEKIKEIIQLLDGLIINNHVSFSYDPSDIITQIRMSGYIPERKSHQFYPTEESLAELAVSMLRIEQYDRILEPSAGNGRLVDKIYTKYKNRIHCVEISQTHCEILKEKGYSVICKDFLEYDTNEKFDKIIMNPPFTKNQAKNHVIKATEHLNDKGRLVAIVPSTLSNLEIKGYNINSSQVIENSFLESDTKVSVVILSISKNEKK